MKIGLIQTKQNELYDFINKDRRFSVEEARRLQEQMIEKTMKQMKEAVHEGCQLIVTPEAMNYSGEPEKITGDYKSLIPDLNDPLFIKISDMARDGNCYIVAGVYRRDGEKLYNSALVYGPDGKLHHGYDKIHLAGSENDYLTPGKDYLVFDTEYGKIGVLICFDMQFPEAARILSASGAELIVCPTWGWKQIYGHARAYENGIYVAAAMGIPYWMDIEGLRNPSEIVSPSGQVLMKGSRSREGLVISTVDIRDCEEMRGFRLKCRRPETYIELYKER